MAKMVTVKAKRRGQLPDQTWVQEGDTFDIDESLVSKLWMEKVPAKASAKKAPAAEPEE